MDEKKYGFVEGITEVVRAAVRPVTTLSMVGTFCYLTVMGLVPLEAFIGIAGPIIGFQYASRQAEKTIKRNP